MKTSRISSFILLVSLLSWVSVTISKPFPYQPDQSHHPKGLKGATFGSKQGVDQRSFEGVKENYAEEEYYRGLMTRLGSIPPNCAHRCERCVPCVPVQTPTTADHVGVQYANYEPEGWRCKCGSTFFNP
ncbi:EPIDERMAL PATTERNING FACTOR-like protein 6 [Argentina anserina]|uniref:EPIDERMAL PATTERNING FACTOR-like protein 6 n=1 Tax=Argentina anserina TaxID=57926 RepID=UPI002176817B|nr:EPIDERMAL PATTERNING FACTOR-like protein 6 [Potentilla anserina]